MPKATAEWDTAPLGVFPQFARSADDAERAPKRLPNPHIFQFYIT